MSVQNPTWENQLLMWAQEALSSPRLDSHIETGEDILNNAYGYSARITRANSATFYMASGLLPEPKRRAAHALYAFCRSTDDLIDETHGLSNQQAVFASWRTRLAHPHPAAHDPVPLAWADTQAHFGIPQGYVEQLIDGVARDLTQTRYADFAELTEYCYGVASTVGLMVMHIIGFRSRDALPYAVKLGIALQLTNILRDIGEDWAAGRLYLPLDELADFGLSEADIAAGRVDDRWRAFMRLQIDRTRQLYKEAEPGIAMLDADGRFAIVAAARLYAAILDAIEARDYDVFGGRAHIGLGGKLKRLPAIWWDTRRLASQAGTGRPVSSRA